jgi:glutamate 5-kinase
MGSKLRSIQRAVEEGIEAVIADGKNPGQLLELAQGGGFGTRFSPSVAAAVPAASR